MFFKSTNQRIYLDFAAATPVRKEVLDAMRPFWSDVFGNAGAIHAEGVQAHCVIEKEREKLARVLHVRPEGIVFTSSGTESNNLAILGTLRARHAQGVQYSDMQVLATAIEHPSILEVLKEVVALGVHVEYVPLGEDGRISLVELEKLVTAKTVLATFAYVNSEIGVIQPVSKVSRILKQAEKKYGSVIYLHLDAAQAPLWLSCEIDTLGADLIALDAGKCCGPKGVGVLAMRHGVTLSPFQFGGKQEGGVRPGTENTPLIVGAVTAIVIAQKNYKHRAAHVAKMRDTFFKAVSTIGGVLINGSLEHRVANNVHISIPGVDSEFAVISLDAKGIACATKSACGGAKGDGSAVVRALTNDANRALSTIRFTLGETTTQREIDVTVACLRAHVDRVRAFIERQ